MRVIQHPCLAEFNSQNIKGRLFKTDEYPIATGGNSNIYRGQLHKNGFKVLVRVSYLFQTQRRAISGRYQVDPSFQ
jgi:hypothetical protein